MKTNAHERLKARDIIWLKDARKACEETIEQYRTGTHMGRTEDCPLCLLDGFACKVVRARRGQKTKPSTEYEKPCQDCPWTVISGYRCVGEKAWDDWRVVAPSYDKAKIPSRIKRLQRWIKLIDTVIAEKEA